MPTYTLVKPRRRARRRNMPFQIRRGGKGRFSEKGGVLIARFPKTAKSKSKSGKRRKARAVALPIGAFPGGLGLGLPKKKRSRKGKGKAKGKKRSGKIKRKKNPGRARRRRSSSGGRRRRRASRSVIVIGGGSPRRRRRRSRRRNPGIRIRRRSFRRRRNPGLGGLGAMIRSPLGFLRDALPEVVAGTAGLSASLWGPKLAGHLIWAPLGRGWGGVGTSLVTVGLTSSLVGRFVGARAGRAVLAGGLIGTFAQALSAISCGLRTQVLPLETSLLACALPTMPGKQVDPKVAQLAASNPALARALGLNDYATKQLRDYARAGQLNDYPNISAPASGGSGMDASKENF